MQSKNLKILWNFRHINGKDIEIPENLPKAKMVFTVVQSSLGIQQIWGMIVEANTILKLLPPVAYMYDEGMTKLKQFCSGKLLVFVHPYLSFDDAFKDRPPMSPGKA